MARIPFGGTIERSVDGTTYTAIGKSAALPLPVGGPETIDITDIDSAYRKFAKGLMVYNDISLTITYTPEQFTVLLADVMRPDPTYYRVTFPKYAGQTVSGDVYSFLAIPSLSGNPTPATDVIKAELMLKITDGVTRVEGE